MYISTPYTHVLRPLCALLCYVCVCWRQMGSLSHASASSLDSISAETATVFILQESSLIISQGWFNHLSMKQHVPHAIPPNLPLTLKSPVCVCVSVCVCLRHSSVSHFRTCWICDCGLCVWMQSPGVWRLCVCVCVRVCVFTLLCICLHMLAWVHRPFLGLTESNEVSAFALFWLSVTDFFGTCSRFRD